MEDPMEPVLLGEAQTGFILHLIERILREVGICPAAATSHRALFPTDENARAGVSPVSQTGPRSGDARLSEIRNGRQAFALCAALRSRAGKEDQLRPRHRESGLRAVEQPLRSVSRQTSRPER